MRKANIKGIANVKGFEFELKIKIDSAEVKSNRHYCGNKDFKEGDKNIKGFDFEVAMKADSAEINIDGFAKEIKDVVKEQIEKNAVSTTK